MLVVLGAAPAGVAEDRRTPISAISTASEERIGSSGRRPEEVVVRPTRRSVLSGTAGPEEIAGRLALLAVGAAAFFVHARLEGPVVVVRCAPEERAAASVGVCVVARAAEEGGAGACCWCLRAVHRL